MSEPRRPFWHLAEQLHWDAALRSGHYDQSTLGATLQQVGFIHCSYPEQLPGVVKLIYSRVSTPLVVLEIDPERLAAAAIEVRDEPGDLHLGGPSADNPAPQLFPHVYGALPVSAVARTRRALVERGWLDLAPWADTPYPQK